MKLFLWILHKIGLQTSKEVEARRANYAKWAIENLTSKDGRITPDCYLYNPFDGDELCIIKDRIEVIDGRMKSVIVAPWCHDVVIARNYITG